MGVFLIKVLNTFWTPVSLFFLILFFFLKTFSNEHFRSQPPCVTSWNQSGGSGSTQLKFRKCAASVCSTRPHCLHWRKYASRYSPVSPKIWYFIKTWKYTQYSVSAHSVCFFWRSYTSWWPFAQTLGFHLWAGSSGRPQTLHGVSEQWHWRVKTAPCYAHALLWLLAAPYHVISQIIYLFSLAMLSKRWLQHFMTHLQCVTEFWMTLKYMKNKRPSR